MQWLDLTWLDIDSDSNSISNSTRSQFLLCTLLQFSLCFIRNIKLCAHTIKPSMWICHCLSLFIVIIHSNILCFSSQSNLSQVCTFISVTILFTGLVCLCYSHNSAEISLFIFCCVSDVKCLARLLVILLMLPFTTYVVGVGVCVCAWCFNNNKRLQFQPL